MHILLYSIARASIDSILLDAIEALTDWIGDKTHGHCTSMTDFAVHPLNRS
jgi:hypothetical protein